MLGGRRCVAVKVIDERGNELLRVRTWKRRPIMTQINAVENPIINSPYEEPRKHWQIEAGKQPIVREGRRLASYFLRVPERAARGRGTSKEEDFFAADEKGQEYLLDLANLLRQRVREWRERDYSGATRTTRELIALWRAGDRAQPLFYAQLEAAETVIFLTEGPSDLRQGVQVPMDDPGPAAKEAGYRAFQRYALTTEDSRRIRTSDQPVNSPILPCFSAD